MAYQENIIFQTGVNDLMDVAWRSMFVDTNVVQNLANVGIELVKFNCHPADGEEGIHVTVRTGGDTYNINLDASAERFLTNQSADVEQAIKNGAFSMLIKELKASGISRVAMLNLLIRTN